LVLQLRFFWDNFVLNVAFLSTFFPFSLTMAATNAAIRSMLRRIGFTANAATYLVEHQGLTRLVDLHNLTDDDVSTLCKVVRRPGGTIEGETAASPRVPNPGIPVSVQAEFNLKLACFFVRFQRRTSRACEPGDVDLDSLDTLREHRLMEKEHVDSKDPPKINPKNWPETIAAIEEHLRGCLGKTKNPLAYVVRDSEAPIGGPFVSRQHELIGRAPINNVQGEPLETFRTDSRLVWEIISKITRAEDCWTYVRAYQRTQDGRAAFLALKNHYLGVNHVDHLSAKAESLMRSARYSMEGRRSSFETYVKLHVDQHQILESLVPYGYSPPDERSKVRLLLDGIQGKGLDSCKAQILSTAGMRQNFDNCVNLFQDFIRNAPSSDSRSSTVAKMHTHTSNAGDDGAVDMAVDDRYYNQKEWRNLSAAKKRGLALKRKKREGNKGKGKQGKQGKQGKDGNPIKISKASIKAIASAIQGSTEDTESSCSGSEEEEVVKKPPTKKSKTTKASSNRNNKALTRKRT